MKYKEYENILKRPCGGVHVYKNIYGVKKNYIKIL